VSIKCTFLLYLGEEEYVASGQSIKKAQHAAAQMALQHTTFQLPQPKEKIKNTCPQNKKPVTPTVELNALAMKLNLPSVYTNLTPLPICDEHSTENFSHSRNSYTELSSPIPRGDFRSNQSTQGVCRFLNADFQPPYPILPRFSLGANQVYFIQN
jgi:double-stranded RNA-binding protein Staufen